MRLPGCLAFHLHDFAGGGDTVSTYARSTEGVADNALQVAGCYVVLLGDAVTI